MRTIRVELGNDSYDILIAAGLLDQVGEHCRQLNLGSKIVIISNPTVASLYLDVVKPSLEEAGFMVYYIEIPDGEAFKKLNIIERLHNQLASIGLDRHSSLLALGGGVVGDIVGFVAATYLRGINFIQVPTTLLAQVDSSVGGKTGVNLESGKNLVGSFYQPKFVLIDTNTLETLPEREFRTGMAEIIKYGVIRSSVLFKTLEQSPQDIGPIIAECCQIKADVVAEDEKESYLRMILNFGHTVGHAIEAVTHYEEYTHGEAIALGMIAAGEIALALNQFSPQEQEALTALIQQTGLPTTFPTLDVADLMDAMTRDKKAREGLLTFVLPETIGSVVINRNVSHEIVSGVIARLIERG